MDLPNIKLLIQQTTDNRRLMTDNDGVVTGTPVEASPRGWPNNLENSLHAALPDVVISCVSYVASALYWDNLLEIVRNTLHNTELNAMRQCTALEELFIAEILGHNRNLELRLHYKCQNTLFAQVTLQCRIYSIPKTLQQTQQLLNWTDMER